MTDKYVGVVYDGPWEGRQCENRYPYFKIAIAPPLSVLDFSEPIANPSVITEHYYRWSRPLRKWVFDPTGSSIREIPA